MNLIRRTSNPLFPSLLDEFFGSDTPFSGLSNRSYIPSVNISETDTNFELALAAPGKSRKDFNVELDDHVLTISSEFKHEDKSNTEQYTRREFRYDNFQRSFRLPETIDFEGIKAKYENGIMTINLPKHEEAIPEPKKKIEIN